MAIDVRSGCFAWCSHLLITMLEISVSTDNFSLSLRRVYITFIVSGR